MQLRLNEQSRRLVRPVPFDLPLKQEVSRRAERIAVEREVVVTKIGRTHFHRRFHSRFRHQRVPLSQAKIATTKPPMNKYANVHLESA